MEIPLFLNVLGEEGMVTIWRGVKRDREKMPHVVN